MISDNADPNARPVVGGTPLHETAHNCHARNVTARMVGGDNPDARDRLGSTPLHLAVARGVKPAILTALLDGGADDSVRDSDGSTTWDWAQEKGNQIGTEV